MTQSSQSAASGNGGLDPARRLSVAQPSPDSTAKGLTLNSPDFGDGDTYPMTHVAESAGGQDRSPALNWSGVPEGTKSLVLTKYDPDAPTGSGYWHWAVYNLPPDAGGLEEGAGNSGGTLPQGAMQLGNDAGGQGFTGAAPPPGDPPHRYIFTLYALDKALDLPPGATPAALGFHLNGAVLAKTRLTATYGR